MNVRKIAAIAAVLTGMLGSGIGATTAMASQARPSPDSSCSKPGSHAVYYTPKLHHRDKLTCERIHHGAHYRDLWKITGH